jgi:hypothetical protein
MASALLNPIGKSPKKLELSQSATLKAGSHCFRDRSEGRPSNAGKFPNDENTASSHLPSRKIFGRRLWIQLTDWNANRGRRSQRRNFGHFVFPGRRRIPLERFQLKCLQNSGCPIHCAYFAQWVGNHEPPAPAVNFSAENALERLNPLVPFKAMKLAETLPM